MSEPPHSLSTVALLTVRLPHRRSGECRLGSLPSCECSSVHPRLPPIGLMQRLPNHRHSETSINKSRVGPMLSLSPSQSVCIMLSNALLISVWPTLSNGPPQSSSHTFARNLNIHTACQPALQRSISTGFGTSWMVLHDLQPLRSEAPSSQPSVLFHELRDPEYRTAHRSDPDNRTQFWLKPDCTTEAEAVRHSFAFRGICRPTLY